MNYFYCLFLYPPFICLTSMNCFMTLWSLSPLYLPISLVLLTRRNIISCNCLKLRITWLPAVHTDFSITDNLLWWSLSPLPLSSCILQFGKFCDGSFIFPLIVLYYSLTKRLLFRVLTTWVFSLLLQCFCSLNRGVNVTETNIPYSCDAEFLETHIVNYCEDVFPRGVYLNPWQCFEEGVVAFLYWY